MPYLSLNWYIGTGPQSSILEMSEPWFFLWDLLLHYHWLLLEIRVLLFTQKSFTECIQILPFPDLNYSILHKTMCFQIVPSPKWLHFISIFDSILRMKDSSAPKWTYEGTPSLQHHPHSNDKWPISEVGMIPLSCMGLTSVLCIYITVV